MKRRRNYNFRRMKLSTKNLFIFIIFILFIIIFSFSGSDDKTFIKDFFKGYGWELESSPETYKDVYIPKKFDNEDENYNILQRDINSDLEKYKGRKAVVYIYKVTNRYLYYNEKKVTLKAEVIVFDNKVIAGSIYSEEAKKIQMSLRNRTVEEIKNEK